MPIMLSPVLTPPVATLLAQCCVEGALADAWAKVHENAGCPGVDGVSVEAFHQQALSRLAELRCAVQEGCYRPQPLLGVAIPKRSGGQRLRSIPTVTDRVLQTAVAQLLTRLLDPDFEDASFVYRTRRSVRQATARIVACRDQGLCWVVDADIERYFDSVDHATLLAMLRRRLPDASLTAVLAQWLAAPVVVEGEVRPRRLGVPQGAPISPPRAGLRPDGGVPAPGGRCGGAHDRAQTHLDPAVDFVLPAEPGQMCKLLPAAKQLFIARLEAKMSAPLACVEGSGKTSLFRMMRAQVARYARAVAGGPAYQSFRVA
ncbi:MAG TPA: reverse transcriptase domain-containing protein [Thauera phenylacetica]|jgi:hypothetical protein|nr:reverse transcriptase domain-containing protein [Thauera phenylacetica]